jgi:hypothetical protein
MSLDLEWRARTESPSAIDYETGNAPVYELTRIRGGLRIQPQRIVSLYAQFHDLHALALPLSNTARNMRDAFDLRQAYVRLSGSWVSLIAGRQELRFGDERLIGISNWTNVSRTFDVLHAILGDSANHLDLFSGSVVKIFPESFDRPTGGFYLHGAYATLTTWIPRTRIEPFLLMKTSPVTSLQGLSGREMLLAPGIRASGTLPAHLNYDAQGILERGDYVNDTIHAGAACLKAGYTAKWLPWAPHLEPEYDYASGNPHRNPMRVSTFDQFYPSNHNAFGLTDLFGWQNIKQRRLNLGLDPTKNWRLLFQGESLHSATSRDDVFTGPATVLISPPDGGFRSDDLGSEFDASLRYASHRHFVLEGGVGHFWPGAVMTQNEHGAPLTLSYFQITYDMHWSKSTDANAR